MVRDGIDTGDDNPVGECKATLIVSQMTCLFPQCKSPAPTAPLHDQGDLTTALIGWRTSGTLTFPTYSFLYCALHFP